MPDKNYSFLTKLLTVTAVIGLGARYGNVYAFHLVLAFLLVRSVLITTPGTLLGPGRLPSAYHQLFVAMVGWFTLSLVWSWNRVYTVQYIGYLSIGSLLSLLIVKYVHTSFQRFGELFSAAGIAFLTDIFIGVLEALTPFRLPTSPYSKYSAIWDSVVELPEQTFNLLGTMPTGFHWNPNNYAAVMNLLLPFFLLHPRAGVRVGGFATVAGLVYATSSRGGLATTAFITLIAPIYWRRSAWILTTSTIVALGSFAFFAGAFSNYEYIENPKLRDALGTIDAIRMYLAPESFEERTSVNARRVLISNGLRALRDTYGLGVGGGADRLVQEKSGGVASDLGSMHHFWIELLVNGGYVFVAGFAPWYAALTYQLFQYSRRLPSGSKSAYYCAALSLTLIGFVPGAIPVSSAVYMLPMYILFGLAIAMVNVCRRWEQESQKGMSAGQRIPAGQKISPCATDESAFVRRVA